MIKSLNGFEEKTAIKFNNWFILFKRILKNLQNFDY